MELHRRNIILVIVSIAVLFIAIRFGHLLTPPLDGGITLWGHRCAAEILHALLYLGLVLSLLVAVTALTRRHP